MYALKAHDLVTYIGVLTDKLTLENLYKLLIEHNEQDSATNIMQTMEG